MKQKEYGCVLVFFFFYQYFSVISLSLSCTSIFCGMVYQMYIKKALFSFIFSLKSCMYMISSFTSQICSISLGSKYQLNFSIYLNSQFQLYIGESFYVVMCFNGNLSSVILILTENKQFFRYFFIPVIDHFDYQKSCSFFFSSNFSASSSNQPKSTFFYA